MTVSQTMTSHTPMGRDQSDERPGLSNITNGLKALGKNYTDTKIVRKVLRSLPLTWHTKATVIEDSKNSPRTCQPSLWKS
ncbi:hypothetical protein Taro_038666 [Colocasia esculenta]|uniref:Uncharacterized protein n=1 Tax=Colocasia esculenta TaxID=4460 RepID=A0A843WJX8_COLES|nr:hypothetical protein [Colocasia esculenta]